MLILIHVLLCSHTPWINKNKTTITQRFVRLRLMSMTVDLYWERADFYWLDKKIMMTECCNGGKTLFRNWDWKALPSCWWSPCILACFSSSAVFICLLISLFVHSFILKIHSLLFTLCFMLVPSLKMIEWFSILGQTWKINMLSSSCTLKMHMLDSKNTSMFLLLYNIAHYWFSLIAALMIWML